MDIEGTGMGTGELHMLQVTRNQLVAAIELTKHAMLHGVRSAAFAQAWDETMHFLHLEPTAPNPAPQWVAAMRQELRIESMNTGVEFWAAVSTAALSNFYTDTVALNKAQLLLVSRKVVLIAQSEARLLNQSRVNSSYPSIHCPSVSNLDCLSNLP